MGDRVEETVVTDMGASTGSCGYCGSPDTNASYYLLAHSLTVDHYQELLDRGWRRAGCILYKPQMEKICCHPYSIRLKVADFKPLKEHTRVEKKMSRFLDGALDLNEDLQEVNMKREDTLGSEANLESQKNAKTEMLEVDSYESVLCKRVDDAVSLCIKKGELPSNIQLPKAVVKKVSLKKKKPYGESEYLLYTTSISFQIKALLGQAKKDDAKPVGYVDLQADRIAEVLAISVQELGELPDISVKASKGHINFCSNRKWPDLIEKPVAINLPQHVTSKKKLKSFEIPVEQTMRHMLETRIKRSSFDLEEYALYKKYQIKVHKDEPSELSESAYTRFLVDSPLVFSPIQATTQEIPINHFGSYHQQYLIDGKLIAVGVVDILPSCLSSVYLFWDPDYAFLSLGKYSALKEIDWVKQLEVQCPQLQYYYLGYYIHSCSKMNYKAKYCPSELLCPLYYKWVPFDIAKPLLDQMSYVVLSDLANLLDGATSSSHDQIINKKSSRDAKQGIFSCCPSIAGAQVNDITGIVIELYGRRLTFQDMKSLFGSGKKRALKELQGNLRSFVALVGEELSRKMVYKYPPY